MYNFKSINVVPGAKDFVDIVLSKTQRKTPTVVHKGYKITRIRAFYTRKVKFLQNEIHDKLTTLVDDFPRLDDVHPFYADLMNVLYDKDHYKVALGQINNVRHLVDALGRDYVRLLKYADSLYRCKQLKRAAMGRMCTLMKKLHGALGYLEQVRQHLARLPSIDPNTRTILIAGFPNVGKSSFINKITRADVDVQPYAFTTKSLFVGHTDYRYMTWQVIDTPGILDHPLEDRNTIEMQAVTALAHLRACTLYFMDLSGTCGFSVEQQLNLFNNIKPLFAGKPLMVVLNKSDLVTIDKLDKDVQQQIRETLEGVEMTQVSVQQNEGVGDLKTKACEMLLAHRLEKKASKLTNESIKSRIYVSTTGVDDDTKMDPIENEFLPDTVKDRLKDGLAPGLTEEEREEKRAQARSDHITKDLEEPTALVDLDLRATWDLPDSRDQYIVVPEIVDGENLADWLDPDIERRLQELEDEEERLLVDEAVEQEKWEREEKPYELDDRGRKCVKLIKHVNSLKKVESAMKRGASNNAVVDTRMRAADEKLKNRLGMKRKRDASAGETSRSKSAIAAKRMRASSVSAARTYSRSMTPKPGSGLVGPQIKEKLKATYRKSQFDRNKEARKGEGDHWIPNLRPKWLLSGKMNTKGKRDFR